MSARKLDPKHRHRVFVVEDHPIVREGIRKLLSQEPDLVVCGEADAQGPALAAIPAARPDLVLMDLALKHGDGLELIKLLHAEHPSLPVLVLSMHDESVYSERALRAGARGYVMKQEEPDQVLVAIRQVLQGNIYVGDRAAQKILREVIIGKRDAPPGGVEGLSDRELQVFRLMGTGFGPGRIAQELHLSVKTVETYLAHIRNKMGLASTEDVRRASVHWLPR